MDFGRLSFEEISHVTFTLPPDPAGNEKILAGKPKLGKIYCGLPKWGRTEWVGPLYPHKTKEKDFLSHYVDHFNAVELNATHYRIWGPAGIAKWAAMAKDKDFRFCPKMYQGITHRGTLKGKQLLVAEFIKGIDALEDHLGPCFIQLHEMFSYRNKALLFQFLESWPKEFRLSLELRHASWSGTSSRRQV